MQKIFYQDRAVAFIDVLGFSALVRSSDTNTQTLKQLETLVNTLNSSVPLLNQQVSSSVNSALIPEHTYISDSIILSAPLSGNSLGITGYSGIDVIALRVIQLTHLLLSEGYLIRGGISVGSVWHSNSNIVGPAYIEAYETECKYAIHPRVLLSHSAEQVWNAQPHKSGLCVNYEGSLIVDGLHNSIIELPFGRLYANVYDSYRQTIIEKIDTLTDSKALKKWIWFQKYFDENRPMGV